jgi:hypothetical protein
MNELEKLNEFLIKVATTDAGIRRKMVALRKYLNDIDGGTSGTSGTFGMDKEK